MGTPVEIFISKNRHFIKRKQENIVYAHGGAYSSFGDSYGGQGCAGEKFILMSVEQAQQWSEEYLDADEYIAIWGEPEE